jgi:hypothetical protein
VHKLLYFVAEERKIFRRENRATQKRKCIRYNNNKKAYAASSA